ncbi:CBS domain-containing protein [Poseidonibacter parvus]|uniref:CBS domain-containing protein n=1 Tax=Poseidonibacter parvus TaxID=1850254 RepID=A0A1P8KKN8_9BACT|nr:CBS domain-containing protein [Poseidonibacter parvus]APW65076.1 CBS domain-containing protein [Poseidonibacter parvus]
MFAIYNNGSVSMRSTADNLYDLKQIDAPSNIQLKPDDDTLFQDYMDSKKNESSNNQKALNIYKKMANIDTTEPVYHVKDIMTRDCATIDSKQTIKEAYDILKELNISQVPVVTFGKKIQGLIDNKTILNLILENLDNTDEILNRKIEDIYLPELITADPISDIRRVSKVMIDFKLHAIPIVDEEDIVIGIVSKTDIIKAVSNLPHLQLWS